MANKWIVLLSQKGHSFALRKTKLTIDNKKIMKRLYYAMLMCPLLLTGCQGEGMQSTGKEPVLVSPQVRTGLSFGVPDPASVGKDRLVDAAYAAAHYPLPVITVDMGTATTFSVVDEQRVFRGGVICPGLSTGLRALGDRCAQLPQVRLAKPRRTVGVNTQEAMLSGSVLGSAVLLDGITQRIEEELGRPATVVVTGGLARYVVPLCRHPMIYDPELLMKGLALIYQLNTQPKASKNQKSRPGRPAGPRPNRRRPARRTAPERSVEES